MKKSILTAAILTVIAAGLTIICVRSIETAIENKHDSAEQINNTDTVEPSAQTETVQKTDSKEDTGLVEAPVAEGKNDLPEIPFEVILEQEVSTPSDEQIESVPTETEPSDPDPSEEPAHAPSETENPDDPRNLNDENELTPIPIG